MVVGTSHDTPDFAADNLVRWWQRDGLERYRSINATTASEAWRQVWTKANGRPCHMMDSRKVQSIDRGRKALAAGRTVRKVGSDGVTEYMADGGMSAEAQG